MNAPSPSDLRSAAEASEWLVRLREEPDNEEVFNGWLRWREADPAHSAAYDRVRSLWHQLDQVNPEAAEASQPRFQDSNGEPRRGRRRATVLALAAGCAAIAFAIGLATHWNDRPPEPATALENRSSVLPDGSAVVLGARTSLAVDFTPNARVLRLSHGEAFFKVNPDPSRPFTVRAGSLDVTAVGTAFDVNHQENRTVVTVQEGLVAVRPSAHLRGTAAASWKVAGGYQFVYSPSAATATLSSVDTSAVLAWREGRLEYTRAPLSAVIADVNRYSQHPIELDGARVGDLTFTGTVFTDSISDWVGALPGALPVDVRRDAGGAVILSLAAGQ